MNHYRVIKGPSDPSTRSTGHERFCWAIGLLAQQEQINVICTQSSSRAGLAVRVVVGIQEVFAVGGVVPVGNNSSRVSFAMVAVRYRGQYNR